MTFISGAFSATFNGKALGTTEDGFEQTTTRIHEEIRADHYRGLLDGIFQGIDMVLKAVFLEADMPGLRDMIWPIDHDNDGTLWEAGHGQVGATGQLLSALAAELILTPCAGSTVATKGNEATGLTLATITYPKVILSTDAVSFKYSTSLKKIPLTLIVLPVPITAPTAPAAVTICASPMKYYTLA